MEHRAAEGWAHQRHSLVSAVLGAFAIVALAGASPLTTTAHATAIDLGTLGGNSSTANAVNGSGQVVGDSETSSGQSHAFSWTQAGGMVDLGTLGGNSSTANAVNGSGQVVGDSETSSGQLHAFSWTQAGGMVDLGTLGHLYSDAYAVNGFGQVVGEAWTNSFQGHAFSWTPAGGMVDLGTLGGSVSGSVAVNDSGQVVGNAETSSPTQIHAFSWAQAGGMVDLGGGSVSVAAAVNDSGQVVGSAETSSELHAFSWTRAGGMVDLGTLPGGHSSEATAVNGSDQVVGTAGTPVVEGEPRGHAFSWTQAGGMVDLGTFGGLYSFASAVNESGQVVGKAYTSSSPTQIHAFSWTPAGGMVDLGTLGGSFSGAVAVNDSGQVVGYAETSSGHGHAMLWETTSSGGGSGGGILSGCIGSPIETWTGNSLMKRLAASLPAGVPFEAEVEVADELTPSATGSCSLLPPVLGPDLPASLDIHNRAGDVSLGLFSHNTSGSPATVSSEPFKYAPPSARDLRNAIHTTGGWYVIPLGTETSTSTIRFTHIEPLEFGATLEDLLEGYLKLNAIQLQAAVAVAAGAVVFVSFEAVAAVAAGALATLGIDEGAGAIMAALRSIFPALAPSPALGGLITLIPAAVVGPAGSAWRRLSGLAAAATHTAAIPSPVAGPVTGVAHVKRLRARDVLKGLRAQLLKGAIAGAARNSVLTLPVPSVIRPLVASRRLPRGGQTVTILGGHLPGTKAELVLTGPGYGAARDVRITHGLSGGRITLPRGRPKGRWYAALVDYAALRVVHGHLLGRATIEAASWVG